MVLDNKDLVTHVLLQSDDGTMFLYSKGISSKCYNSLKNESIDLERLNCKDNEE